MGGMEMSWNAAELESAFRDAYVKTFGITLDNTVEVIVLRVAIRRTLKRTISNPNLTPVAAKTDVGAQQVYSFARDRDEGATTHYREGLRIGERKRGPAVIYEDTATTYVDADFSFCLNRNSCLLLTREDA